MKTTLLQCLLFLAFPMIALAGGNSSVVEIENVVEIKVEEKRITLKGSAVIKRRVISTKEKGDTSVFGQPAQWLHAKVDQAVFEIVPYFTPDIQGVPTGGHSQEELKRLSEKWWKRTHADALKIKKGDSVTIGYQGRPDNDQRRARDEDRGLWKCDHGARVNRPWHRWQPVSSFLTFGRPAANCLRPGRSPKTLPFHREDHEDSRRSHSLMSLSE